jgi:hypothetical protein
MSTAILRYFLLCFSIQIINPNVTHLPLKSHTHEVLLAFRHNPYSVSCPGLLFRSSQHCEYGPRTVETFTDTDDSLGKWISGVLQYHHKTRSSTSTSVSFPLWGCSFRSNSCVTVLVLPHVMYIAHIMWRAKTGVSDPWWYEESAPFLSRRFHSS